jgi:hypothetical protein
MAKDKIFKYYEDNIDRNIRDFFDLYFTRKIKVDNCDDVLIFSGPLENDAEANQIIDDLKDALDDLGDNVRSDGERLDEFGIDDFLYDNPEYLEKLNSLGYSVDYEGVKR